MSKCPDCGTEMKPLATSVYCPNDCDRKVTEYIEPERTEKIYFLDPIFSPTGLHGPTTIAFDPDSGSDKLFSDDDLDAILDGLFDGTD